jgi:hypothetical protein
MQSFTKLDAFDEAKKNQNSIMNNSQQCGAKRGRA